MQMESFLLQYIDTLKKGIDEIDVNRVLNIVEMLLDAYSEDKQIFVLGNGGSGSTAAHFACDMNKGVSFDLNKRFKVICLNDNIPTMLAYANDNSYEDIFLEQLKNFIRPGDIVIGISASGNSENILKAIKYANEFGAKTIGLTGFDGGNLKDLVMLDLVVDLNDMQKVEDIHLIISHMIMQIAHEKLHGIS